MPPAPIKPTRNGLTSLTFVAPKSFQLCRGTWYRIEFGCEDDLSNSLEKSTWTANNRAMLDWSTCPAVERSPDKLSGAWRFKGTRVPVKALFENLEGGARVDEFLDWFPGVTREQVEAVLLHAEQSLIEA